MKRLSDDSFSQLLGRLRDLERSRDESRQMLWLLPWLVCMAIFLVAVLRDIFLWGIGG